MSEKQQKCYVFLDGRLIGNVKSGRKLAEEIRKNRRLGVISGEVNVAYVKKLNEVHINADRGRARKPYIVVEKGASKLTGELSERLKNREIDFNYLVRRGIIEYLDAEEEENSRAALTPNLIDSRTTHLEIDKASMLGLTMNLIVFPEYNSIGRHPISSNFAKQSQGLYAINFNKRYDPRAFLLYYPQEPIVNSLAYRTLRMNRHPTGHNLVVALSTYYGYNMKDAVILNRAAVDRGLGRSVAYKTYSDEERRYPGSQQDYFKVPPATTEGYLGEHSYAKLSEDGIIETETEVNEGDALIGKVSPPRFLEEQTSFGVGEEKRRDNSVTLKAGEQGVVDSVLMCETTSATRIAKVRIRSNKTPEVGDKFASRHGQKGVVALIVDQNDMPFTSSGIVPDLLLNPLSLPSRMTFGHMLEMLGGKVGSLKGERLDGTAFATEGKSLVEEYGKILEGYGFDRFGDEVLYDGRTGKRFNAKVFTGVVYYNRLMHMVSLKLQVRSRGPVQILTHQPTEGKPRRGGLKFGEMERDALVAHGASLLLKERMLDQSDKAEIWICRQCGDVGYYDYIKNVPVCPNDGGNNLEMVEISYAFKLLFDEIKSLHILPRIRLKSE
ncbi:MAG: DNA-directed RNA polymerase subunit B [Candidatus Micrarchaeota archaeon]|nr:DNA-directed RNA polymerase subunit B [Candidatus Micrarchaeota archaeon]